MKKILINILILMLLMSIGTAYAAEGDVLWSEDWGDPYNDNISRSVAVDSQNNVIVTGYTRNSSGNDDWYTIKYDPNGNVLWEKRYDGGIGYDDQAYGVAVDSQNNVIVVGYTVKEDSTTTPTIKKHYLTIKYDPNGNVLWDESDYVGMYDAEAHAVAVDSNDNIIVAGNYGQGNEVFWHVKKYRSDGYEICYAEWNSSSPENGNRSRAYAYGVAVDSKDNFIVAGYAWDGEYYYWVTRKYGPNCNFTCYVEYHELNSYAGDGRYDARAYSVAVDSNDNFIVTGQTLGKQYNDNWDILTIKYDSNCNVVCSVLFSNPGPEYPPMGVAVDSDDNFIVAGGVASTSNGDVTAYFIKYGPDCKEVLSVRNSTPESTATAVAIDSNNNIIVTGFYTNPANRRNNDYLTTKYEGKSPAKKVTKRLPETILYPKVDIEQFSVVDGDTIIKDGKVIAAYEISPGVQKVLAQVENRGLFTQTDVRVRFEGIPQGATLQILPESQKIKAKNVGTYDLTFTLDSNTPQGKYDITMIAYTPKGTLDRIVFTMVVP